MNDRLERAACRVIEALTNTHMAQWGCISTFLTVEDMDSELLKQKLTPAVEEFLVGYPTFTRFEIEVLREENAPECLKALVKPGAAMLLIDVHMCEPCLLRHS